MAGWLRRWLRPGASAASDAVGLPVRWVVIDVETTGLDPARDEVLAIGAVAVLGQRLQIDDSLEIAVRPARVSGRANILVHGIGAGAQLAGIDPTQAARELRDHVGDAVLLAWHASFDQAFLERLFRVSGLEALSNRWIDLADLAPALAPDIRARDLDEWLKATGIPVDQRHHAVGDAWATAMLFARLLADVAPGERAPGALARRITQSRWLSPRS